MATKKHVSDQSTELKKNWLTKKNILLGVVILFVLGILIPLFSPDVNGGHSNIERQAASAAIEHIRQYSQGIDGIGSIGTIKLVAEKITPDNPDYANAETLCNNTFRDTSDPQAVDRYLVTVASKTIFGLTLRTDVVHVCRIK